MAAVNRRPYIPTLIFTAFCAVLVYLVFTLTTFTWTPVHMLSVLFFGALTLALHLWQERNIESDPKGFVRRFMVGLSVKLFASLLVIVIMLLTMSENRVAAVLVFIFLYLAFLAFSTVRLVSLSKKR